MAEDSRIAWPSTSSTGTRLAGLSSRRRGGRWRGSISISSTSTPFSAKATRTLPANGDRFQDHRRREDMGASLSDTSRRCPSPRSSSKAVAFRALHEGDPFVIPNPWDAGSARVLEALGFRALATTSSGFAFTLGRLDGAATLGEIVEHVRRVAAATTIPLSVDLENGHGSSDEAPAQAITRVAAAGAVGASIEDWDQRDGLYSVQRACRARGRGSGRGPGPGARLRAHRAGREPHPRQPRPRRHDRPPAGL